MVGVGTPLFLAALWCLLTTPSAWARLGNHTTDRRLLERTTNSTLPAFAGCHTIRNQYSPAECCRHHDARGDPRYEGELCTPSFSGTGLGLAPKFSNGNLCEPRCWTRGECGNGVGVDHGLNIGACPAPSKPARYTLGVGGLTCQQQSMVDLTEQECYGQAFTEALGVTFFSTEANPGFDVPYGCFVLSSQTCSASSASVYFQGAQGPQAQRTSPCSDLMPPGRSRWTDSLSRGCGFYAESVGFSRCTLFGDAFPSFGGFTANNVCCACGGGAVSYSPAPSVNVRYFCGSLERVSS